jgi:uncharacterized protein (DUF885 family)
VLAAARKVISEKVYPAYQAYMDYFKQIKAKAGLDGGCWRLKGGDIAYLHALQFYSTTNYSADDIHNLGLTKVDRVQVEIVAVLARRNFKAAKGRDTRDVLVK